MRKAILITTALITSAVAVAAVTHSQDTEKSTAAPLCVIWSSSDPGVAKNVCFMYVYAAKRNGWFEHVHLVVWGPSAKLLAESEELQTKIRAMQDSGVVVEACVTCANNYGVADDLRALDIDVKPMGVPLSERLKASWKVLTF